MNKNYVEGGGVMRNYQIVGLSMKAGSDVSPRSNSEERRRDLARFGYIHWL